MSATSSWRRSAGYIWAMLGSAVGFANLLSFSAHCYRGGGGAFLLPYFAAMLLVGIPMLLLEASIGQHFRTALTHACRLIGVGRSSLWGWLAVVACATIGSFYVVLTGYSIVYFVEAAAGRIPEDTAAFFRNEILQLTPSLHQLGPCVLPLVAATCAVLLLTYLVNRKPVSSGIERACSYFMPLLGLFALAGAIAVSFLPGAQEGIARLFSPHIELLCQPQLWRDIFGQLFFSYSLGLGIVVGYSAHADGRVKLLRAMTWVALGDFAFSLLAAIVIFGCIGAASYEQQVPFDSWLVSDSTFEIGFVVYPKVLQTFGPWIGRLLQMLLFFSLFVAGVTGVFSIVESIVGNLQWRFRMTRELTVRCCCLLLLLGATPFCFGVGPHLIDALAPVVLGLNMLLGACALILLFLARPHLLQGHPLFASGRLRRYLLLFVLPWALLNLLGNLYQEWQATWNLATALRWGWMTVAIGLSWWLSSPYDQLPPTSK